MISKVSLETPQLSKSPIEYAGTASAMQAAMVYAQDHGLRRGSINLMIQTPKFVFSDITTGQEVGMTLEHTRQAPTESECGPGQTSVPDIW